MNWYIINSLIILAIMGVWIFHFWKASDNLQEFKNGWKFMVGLTVVLFVSTLGMTWLLLSLGVNDHPLAGRIIGGVIAIYYGYQIYKDHRKKKANQETIKEQ